MAVCSKIVVGDREMIILLSTLLTLEDQGVFDVHRYIFGRSRALAVILNQVWKSTSNTALEHCLASDTCQRCEFGQRRMHCAACPLMARIRIP
jgi:hypothetical protein